MTDSAGLHASLNLDGDRAIIALSGDIDCVSGPMLADLLGTVMNGSCLYVEVDMTQVSFVDTAGLRVLFRARRLGLQHGVALTLLRPPAHIVWLMQITDTTTLLNDVTTLDGDDPAGPPEPVRRSASRQPRQDNASSTVDQQADHRDQQADHRDQQADERDRRADERDRRAADLRRLDAERSRLLDERLQRVLELQQWEDIREDVANERERDLERRERDC